MGYTLVRFKDMIAYRWRARPEVGRALRWLQGRGIILLYHRVATHVPDPQLLCVSPSHFAEHLDYVRRYYYPISLRQLAQSLRSGKIPRKAIVITFDDGYVDNLWYARPLLEKYDCPATMFVVSGYVGKDRELLSDELERLLLASVALPQRLVLMIGGQQHSWHLDNAPAQRMAWNITQEADPSPRHRCYRDLHRLLRPLNQMQREETMAALARWAGCPRTARQDRRVMHGAELRALSQDGLVEVGAHTVSHLLLAAQPVEIQRREIAESKRELEDLLGVAVTSLAYPYGGVADFTERTSDFAREAGFAVTCANIPGIVTRDSGLFNLPRFLVRDWTGDEFDKELGNAFPG